MNKHTPGPWVVSDIASGFEIETTSGNQVAQTSEIYAARKPSDHDERRANARLIAASPEMLDILKKCLDALVYVGPWETPVGLIEQVQKMIDKAEGNDAAL